MLSLVCGWAARVFKSKYWNLPNLSPQEAHRTTFGSAGNSDDVSRFRLELVAEELETDRFDSEVAVKKSVMNLRLQDAGNI